MGLRVWLRTARCWFGAGVLLGFAAGLVMVSTCLVGTLVVDEGLPLLGLFLPGQIRGVEMNPNEGLELRELEGPTRGWTSSAAPGASGTSGLGLDPGSFGEELVCREAFPGGNVVLLVVAGPEGRTFRGPGASRGLLLAAGLDPEEPRTRPASGIRPLAAVGPAHMNTDAVETELVKKGVTIKAVT